VRGALTVLMERLASRRARRSSGMVLGKCFMVETYKERNGIDNFEVQNWNTSQCRAFTVCDTISPHVTCNQPIDMRAEMMAQCETRRPAIAQKEEKINSFKCKAAVRRIESRARAKERKMAMGKRSAMAQTNNGQNMFPPEAEQFYGEVPEQQMKVLREESCATLKDDEWELVDGFDFPYEQCA